MRFYLFPPRVQTSLQCYSSRGRALLSGAPRIRGLKQHKRGSSQAENRCHGAKVESDGLQAPRGSVGGDAQGE